MAGCLWSWWDLWFCVIAVKDHDGGLGAMAAELATRIRDEKRARVHGGDSDDARLSHLFDLAERLRVAGLRPADLAGPAVGADRKITARARAKLKGRIPEGGYARTMAMRDLPRERLLRRARHGRWFTFPTDPTAFYDLFRPTVHRTGWVSEHQTGRIVRTLETRLASLDGPRRGLADRLSLYRAFFTAAAEFADIADDSFGHLGDLRTETWLEYLDIDWRTVGMAPDHYWTDLCDLYVWEDYAIDHRNEQAWFRSAEYSEIPLIEGILTGIAVEAGSYVLDYQADRAHAARARLPHTAPTHGSGPPRQPDRTYPLAMHCAPVGSTSALGP